MAVKKKKVTPVEKAVAKRAPKKALASKTKAVIKFNPVPKIVTKTEAFPKSSDNNVEVVPKVLTGEGWLRRRIAALKNKK